MTPSGVTGLITGAHRRHFEVELSDGTSVLCAVKGRRLSPACGDQVDITIGADREGVILGIHPRASELARQDAYRQITGMSDEPQDVDLARPLSRWERTQIQEEDGSKKAIGRRLWIGG